MSVRVAIVGGGFIGQRHAEAISKNDGLEVVAVAGRSPETLEAFTDQFPVPATSDYHEVLERDDVDVVLVATPHHLHTQIAVDSLRSGRHLMLEKPMALTLDECDQIIDAGVEANRQIMVGFTYRFSPHYLAAKKIIDSGELGSPVLCVSTVSKGWWVPNRRDWHLDRTTGGGMWLVAGIHGLDRMSWLLDASPTSVSAHLATRFHDIQADDSAVAFYRYSNGTAGVVVSVGYETGVAEHRTELTFTGGKVTIDDTNGVMIGRDDTWEKIDHDVSDHWSMLALEQQWRDLRDALVEGRPVHPDGIEGRETMAALFAAERSNELGEEVEITHRSHGIS